MRIPHRDSARRSPLGRVLGAALGVTISAGVCLAAASVLPALDLTNWTEFDPDSNWNVSFPTATSLSMTETAVSSSVHPGWVVSDFNLAPVVQVEFDLSVSAGTGDDDFIGLGFSYLDGSHSWLMDWKKTAETFNWGQPVAINDDLAEQGLKIKRINGSYTWDGLWGGQDGLGVSTIAGPTGGGWVAGTVYHFVMLLSPGRICVMRDGVGIFDLLDPSYPGGVGAITSYGFSQGNINLADIRITPAPWFNLGHGKAGLSGLPQLSGSGPMSDNSLNQITLVHAAPSSPATLVFGLSAINAPFKGGMLVPQPLLLVPLGTNALGAVSLPFTWPAGVPAGLSAYFQYWIQDGSATFGYSSSNGLKGVSSGPVSGPSNLLINGDAETGDLTGWTDPLGHGFTVSTSPQLVYAGAFSFTPGQFGPSGAWNQELLQTVDVSGMSADIDAGTETSVFTGVGRSNSIPGSVDPGSVVLEFLNAGGAVLQTYASGTIAPTNTWIPLCDMRLMPVGTRTLRLRLIGSRTIGLSTDCFFDDLVLMAE
jgi:Thrombospondin C-terminal region